MEKLDSISWFHTFMIDGVKYEGRISEKTEQWISQFIPEDLRGKRVLDVGAADGYYSILCEKRGAEVIATDLFPDMYHFELVKRLLKSHAEYRKLDVYEVDKLPQKFDFVLFLGVLYHLSNPILALEKIRQQLKPNGKMLMETAYIISRKSIANLRLPGYAKDGGGHWRPSPKCLENMCIWAGFNKVRILAKTWCFPWRRGRLLLEASM